MSAENSGKPLGGRGTAPNRAGELTAPPQTWAASPGGVWGTMPPTFGTCGVQRGTMQYQTGVKYFNEKIIFSASFTTNVIIP